MFVIFVVDGGYYFGGGYLMDMCVVMIGGFVCWMSFGE